MDTANLQSIMEKTIKGPDGNAVTGEVIAVTRSTEQYSDVELGDGAIIRLKATASEALRLDDMKDEDGNPVYHLKIHTIISLHQPPEK